MDGHIQKPDLSPALRPLPTVLNPDQTSGRLAQGTAGPNTDPAQRKHPLPKSLLQLSSARAVKQTQRSNAADSP